MLWLVVEQPDDIGDAEARSREPRGNDGAGGRRADHAGEEALGQPRRPRIDFRDPRTRRRSRGRVTGKGFSRGLRADEARGQVAKAVERSHRPEARALDRGTAVKRAGG